MMCFLHKVIVHTLIWNSLKSLPLFHDCTINITVLNYAEKIKNYRHNSFLYYTDLKIKGENKQKSNSKKNVPWLMSIALAKILHNYCLMLLILWSLPFGLAFSYRISLIPWPSTAFLVNVLWVSHYL